MSGVNWHSAALRNDFLLNKTEREREDTQQEGSGEGDREKD